MDTEALWDRLCSLLDDDEQLLPAVEAALGEPDGDPWDALLDGLDDAGALASLEAEDTGMELADALAQLPRVFRLQPDLGGVTDTDDLDDAVREADRVLEGHGYRLLILESDDADVHELVVVPEEAVGPILETAEALERSIALPS
ncbi:MAG TPA: hypothetical protein VGO26_01015 [Amnibacterium sp.]|jgi:hypothetical protein|nr:hypothetical protein [Amnibacterium sp.]